ncbi:DNA translocase FtsK [Bacillus sp. SCS-153A]|uniref:DNA translocase FtsK n=1 Tax=Rossellomorea sedimentorum TaxID=3115294 RepID=UPI0039067459
MSWLKKMFGRLKDDEFHSNETSYQEERQIDKPKEKNKEIEARVSYQYPKGEFRFPVIPDKRETGREERAARSEQRRQRHNPAKNEEAPVEKEVEVGEERPQKAKVSQKDEAARRPFRPTEIPSPIYGFSKPVKKDPIQFELKSSEPRSWRDTEEVRIQENEIESKKTSVEETELASTEAVPQSFEVPEEKLAYNEPSSVMTGSDAHTDSVHAERTEEPNKVIESSEEATAENPAKTELNLDAQVETDVPDLQTEDSTMELDEVEEPEAEISFSLEEPTPEAKVEELEEETGYEESSLKSEVPAISVESTQEAPIEDFSVRTWEDEEHSAPSVDSEVSIINEESAQDLPTEAPVGDTAQELHQESDSSASAPAAKRSHLPFNVLMLNQDKRSLDRKKRLAEMKAEKVDENLDECRQPEKPAVESDEQPPDIEKTATSQLEETIEPHSMLEAHEVSESKEPEEEIQQIQDEETSASTASEEHDPAEDVTQQEPQSKRSHLPFNVLMLKQDKRKMGHRYEEEKTVSAVTSEVEETMTDDTSLKQYEELADLPAEDKGYSFPQLNFLAPPVVKESSSEWLEIQRDLLNDTLANFNVRASVVNVTEGPSVTRFEVQPEPGVKVNKITNLADDIKLSLAARDIRIEAPIPGKHTIGIEVPNKESRPVALSEIISSSAFQESSSPLTAALGLDISGEPIVTDLNKMPHGLIAGATGSGKSVCINSILISLLYKASPQDLKLLLIDPKMVELAPYNRMPHLVSPVITDVKAATAALKWAVEEMERRYELFAHTGVRDITRYNLKAERNGEKSQKLPYLVIVIDELADLMMMSPADVEEAICRIAQKARACGIHLIIATQRPSVDVITGLIKANVPTRVAFSVSSGVDSRTIIDSSGAEKLLGKGDMLFLENGSSKPVRLQGTFVSDDEIDEIVNHVREQGEPDYLFQQDELLKKAEVNEQEDDLFIEACEFVVDQGGASTSLIQRHFRVGYNRAARLIDMMENHGIVSEAKGSKPRDVLISSRELEELQDTSTIM